MSEKNDYVDCSTCSTNIENVAFESNAYTLIKILIFLGSKSRIISSTESGRAVYKIYIKLYCLILSEVFPLQNVIVSIYSTVHVKGYVLLRCVRDGHTLIWPVFYNYSHTTSQVPHVLYLFPTGLPTHPLRCAAQVLLWPCTVGGGRSAVCHPCLPLNQPISGCVGRIPIPPSLLSGQLWEEAGQGRAAQTPAQAGAPPEKEDPGSALWRVSWPAGGEKGCASCHTAIFVWNGMK